MRIIFIVTYTLFVQDSQKAKRAETKKLRSISSALLTIVLFLVVHFYAPFEIEYLSGVQKVVFEF